MLKRSGAKPLEFRKPLLSEEEIRKLGIIKKMG
jgi:hypothetical protein